MKISKSLKLALKSILLDVKMGEIVAKENTLIFDGEEYAVGTEVFVKDTENEGEVITAPDGEYTIIEGDKDVKIIVVTEGKIAEIREIETETETEAPETEIEVEAETITDTEIEILPADETEDEAETETKQEDEIQILKDRVEEMTKGMAEMLNKIAALEGKVEVLEDKMAKVEAEPAADPVEDVEVEETKMSRLSYLRKK